MDYYDKYKYSNMNTKSKDDMGIFEWGCLSFIVIVFLLMFASCNGCLDGSDSSLSTSECGQCGKTFTNSADVKSIRKTGLCEPCYGDYKLRKDIKDEVQKYKERNYD